MQIIQAVSHALWNGVYWSYTTSISNTVLHSSTEYYSLHTIGSYYSGMLSVSGRGGQGTLKQARATNQMAGLPYNNPR